jgi:hypothetical protein
MADRGFDDEVIKRFSMLIRAIVLEGNCDVVAIAERLATSPELALAYQVMVERGDERGIQTLRALAWGAIFDNVRARTRVGRNMKAMQATRVFMLFRDQPETAMNDTPRNEAEEACWLVARNQEQWCEGLLSV